MDRRILPFLAILIIVLVFAAFLMLRVPEDSGNGNVQLDEESEYAGILFMTVDVGEVSLEELLSNDRPLLIYFFTTWCSTCEKDLMNLNEVYEEYSESVDVLVVGFDASESLEKIRDYKEKRNYTWTFAEYNKDAIIKFNVVTQASKVGLNREGEVEFSEGFGVVGNDGWRSLLQQIVT